MIKVKFFADEKKFKTAARFDSLPSSPNRQICRDKAVNKQRKMKEKNNNI